MAKNMAGNATKGSAVARSGASGCLSSPLFPALSPQAVILERVLSLCSAAPLPTLTPHRSFRTGRGSWLFAEILIQTAGGTWGDKRGSKMRGEGFAESPKGLSCERGIRGMLVSTEQSCSFPQCHCSQETQPGVFQVMHFWKRGGLSLDRSRAETQRLFRARRVGLSLLPPGSLAAGP